MNETKATAILLLVANIVQLYAGNLIALLELFTTGVSFGLPILIAKLLGVGALAYVLILGFSVISLAFLLFWLLVSSVGAAMIIARHNCSWNQLCYWLVCLSSGLFFIVGCFSSGYLQRHNNAEIDIEKSLQSNLDVFVYPSVLVLVGAFGCYKSIRFNHLIKQSQAAG